MMIDGAMNPYHHRLDKEICKGCAYIQIASIYYLVDTGKVAVLKLRERSCIFFVSIAILNFIDTTTTCRTQTIKREKQMRHLLRPNPLKNQVKATYQVHLMISLHIHWKKLGKTLHS